ncbi:hypothetical protein [Natrinema longum]|uniref:Uncharacterized protein n=1 Tax=Natrinema longum TaxID=370324 RepID=A0A8A2U8K3_9EURY|nr:hypothetical protein [Natrinema longum]MBZ6493672.1 hypothetical protein [Natrinema longum]QSW84987.1 hypothetical protein J0X27_16295 [Natrinema longum]
MAFESSVTVGQAVSENVPISVGVLDREIGIFDVGSGSRSKRKGGFREDAEKRLLEFSIETLEIGRGGIELAVSE